VLDLFSGTSRVGHALKLRGYRVLANDHNVYAATLGGCYVEADKEDMWRDAPGYFTETYCIESRFFQPKNGERIDAIREAIEEKGLSPALRDVMLVSLMEAADRVDSTTGVQMAYLKQWAPRAYNDLELRVPELLPRAKHGKGKAYCLDAFEAAVQLEADVAYIDPPYNQHSYLGNYHVWESLVRWDKPAVYGVACKRIDCRTRRSVFNSRPRFRDAMQALLRSVRAQTLVVSFNDEGYLPRSGMESVLAGLWGGSARVLTIARDYKRYVGAQIGIHNPQGRKVGKVSHLRNTEFVYVASRVDLESALRPLLAQPATQAPLFAV
jgi:adenine-specific DNA-methyltransferase